MLQAALRNRAALVLAHADTATRRVIFRDSQFDPSKVAFLANDASETTLFGRSIRQSGRFKIRSQTRSRFAPSPAAPFVSLVKIPYRRLLPGAWKLFSTVSMRAGLPFVQFIVLILVIESTNDLGFALWG